MYALERALRRCGFEMVAGADEAGRGACAGPLVAAAVVLPAGPGGEIKGLNDSKLLSAAAREQIYTAVIATAVAYAVAIVEPREIDTIGLQAGNLAGMRRAVAALSVAPGYVLTDGFGVDGLGAPALAIWKGDRVAACVAAASVVAKVTRDRIMAALDLEWPDYGFAVHKGYGTNEHSKALKRYGPCPHHRLSYANVAAVAQLARERGTVGVAPGTAAGMASQVGENVSMEGGPQ
jgi:ribonuclease HII